MRTSSIVPLALVAALIFPSLAAAKGPTAATMRGPGISGGRHLIGQSENGTGTPLGALTMDGGVFPEVFGQVPDPTLAKRPAGNLGPRYTITYKVPGPGGVSLLRQDFYPYAKPAPLTYMQRQTFWGIHSTHGGWFSAPTSLPGKLGLPPQPPAATTGTNVWRWLGVGAGALVLAAAIGLLVLHRRPHARPASA